MIDQDLGGNANAPCFISALLREGGKEITWLTGVHR